MNFLKTARIKFVVSLFINHKIVGSNYTIVIFGDIFRKRGLPCSGKTSY